MGASPVRLTAEDPPLSRKSMATQRVIRRVFCDGRQYEIGDLVDEAVGAVLGREYATPETEASDEATHTRKAKPVRKVATK